MLTAASHRPAGGVGEDLVQEVLLWGGRTAKGPYFSISGLHAIRSFWRVRDVRAAVQRMEVQA